MNLDRIDFEMLGALQRDARISNKDLAAAVGLSPSSCLERFRRLRRGGILRGFHADVSPEALGISVQAMISLRLRQHAKISFDALLQEMSRIKEVVNVYLLAGETDFLVHVAVRDVAHLRSVVVDTFTSRYEVAHIETSLIFEFRKAPVLPNYRLPADEEDATRSGR